jgi:hypothetical protein
MGRFGWHSGYIKAQNIQKGTASVTIAGSGDGSASVTFDRAFKSAPVVVVTPQERDITGNYSVRNITNVGCTIFVDNASTTSDVSVGYIAFDE